MYNNPMNRILSIAFLCLAVGCCGLRAEDRPQNLRSPKDLANWLSKDFTYQWRMPMATQSAEETIETKQGSCLDFAILSQNVLAGMGIHCDIAVIKFTDLNIRHAICIWKDDKGYSFMTNKEYVQTELQSVEQAVAREYPDWEEITFMSPDNKYGRIIKSEDRNR